MSLLSRRACLAGRAITLCTITALLVCAVVATLFAGAFARWDVSLPIAILFITAMLAFFAGLLIFLREISISTATPRIGPQ
jgi:hypothetical protein